MVSPTGAILPNRLRTPGAVNSAVTQQTIGQTICRAGWTASVRPPASVIESLKLRQLASGYAYNGDLTPGHYKEDHLISLELGGDPLAEANLWPEPYSGVGRARMKDIVEDKLHALVCSGAVSLAVAQKAIATNWWSAYQSYVLTPVPAASASAAPTPAVPGILPFPEIRPVPEISSSPQPGLRDVITSSGGGFNPSSSRSLIASKGARTLVSLSK